MIIMTVIVVQCFTNCRQNTLKMVLNSCRWTNYCNKKYPIMFSKTIHNVLAVFPLNARLHFGSKNMP